MVVQGFVHMEFYGDSTQVEAMLDRIELTTSPIGLANFLHNRVDPYMRERLEARFRLEGDDVTGPWEPLKQATQDIRSSLGYGAAHPINVRTGELEAYITGSPSGVVYDGIGAVMTMPGSVPQDPELRTKVRTAQRGKVDPRTPARPVMGMNEQDLAVVMTDLALYITYGGVIP